MDEVIGLLRVMYRVTKDDVIESLRVTLYGY